VANVWQALGAALVLGASAAAGFVVAGSYGQRAALLRALHGGLAMLLTEIRYGATPLPEALERVARHGPPAAAPLFAQAARGLSGPVLVSAAEAWRRSVIALRRRWALTEADEAALLELAPYLGQTFADDQERHLRLALERLARQQQEAAAEVAVQSRLWRGLGACGGALLVLLLY